MQIHGPAQIHGPQSINPPHRSAAPQPTTQPAHAAPVDQLDISREADLISRMHDIPDVRNDRVHQVKAQIAAGVYESDDKLDVALDRLLDEIG